MEDGVAAVVTVLEVVSGTPSSPAAAGAVASEVTLSVAETELEAS